VLGLPLLEQRDGVAAADDGGRTGIGRAHRPPPSLPGVAAGPVSYRDADYASPLAIVLALVCTLSMVMISTLGSHSQTILKDNYRSVLAVQRMKEAAERLDDSLMWALLKEQQGEGMRQISAYRQQFEQELQVQEGNITESGEHTATQRLRALWNEHQQKLDLFWEIREREAAKQFYSTELETAVRALRATLEEILAINQDSMVRKSVFLSSRQEISDICRVKTLMRPGSMRRRMNSPGRKPNSMRIVNSAPS